MNTKCTGVTSISLLCSRVLFLPNPVCAFAGSGLKGVLLEADVFETFFPSCAALALGLGRQRSGRTPFLHQVNASLSRVYLQEGTWPATLRSCFPTLFCVFFTIILRYGLESYFQFRNIHVFIYLCFPESFESNLQTFSHFSTKCLHMCPLRIKSFVYIISILVSKLRN